MANKQDPVSGKYTGSRKCKYFDWLI
jgi:hypothetical protein